MEKFFEFTKILDENKLKLITYKLKGGDVLLWTNLIEEHHLLHKSPIISWQPFHDLLYDKFFPKDM